MNENDNGGNMEQKISTDPKIIKMFRRLEKFLDAEGLLTFGRSVNFQNAETGRVFAVFLSPDSYQNLTEYNAALSAALETARLLITTTVEHIDSLEETIAVLEDDKALLSIIDAQNDVLQGRVFYEEVDGIKIGDMVEFKGLLGKVLIGTVNDIEPTLYIRTPTNEFGNGWRRKPEEVTKVDTEACAPREFDNVAWTFTGNDVVNGSMFDRPPDEEQVNPDVQQWAFVGGIHDAGFPDLKEFHPFTSDAIRREQPFG